MPSPYRPRPIESKQCQHCRSTFETRHQRAQYCCNSCRTQAFYARHGRQLIKADSEGVELSSSWDNVAIIAGAVGAVDLTKHLLSQPTQPQESVAALTQQIHALKQKNSLLQAQLSRTQLEEIQRQIIQAQTAGR